MKRLGRRLFNFAFGFPLLACLVAVVLWWASYQPALRRSEMHSIEQGAMLAPGLSDWGSRDGKIALLRVRPYDSRSLLGNWGMLGVRFERRISTPLHAWPRFETLEISYAWPVGVSAALSLLAFRLRRRKPWQPGICHICGYDLRASPQRCPECGNEVSAS